MPRCLRFTPCDISGYSLRDFLGSFDTYVCAVEYEGTEREHFHIYIDSSLSEDSIKRRVYEHLRVKPGQRGKANKYFSLKEYATNDISYVCKNGKVIFYKGFSIDEINSASIIGQQKYPEKIEVVPVKTEIAKKQNIWQTYISVAKEYIEGGKTLETYADFTKMINFYHISMGEPFPQKANTSRYAHSLSVLVASGWGKDMRLLEHLSDLHSDYSISLEQKPT